MKKTRVFNAIYCNKTRRGKGVENDPIRIIREIIDFDGNLIMEDDPEIMFTMKDMIEFRDKYFYENAAHLRKELSITEDLYNKLLKIFNEIPECKSHGKTCIPNAIDYIRDLKSRAGAIATDGCEE